jgi:hypothetical protein
MKHQEDAGDGKDDKEKAGNPPKTERIGESKTMAFDLCRENVKEKVVVD